MIYIFDKTQAIIKVLTNDDFTAAHLNFKINTATTFEFSLPASKALPSGSKYVATPHPLNGSKFIMLRLTERVDNTETIDYSAYELAYQELATDGYIEDKRPQNQSALNLMKIALDGSNWELNNVNVSGAATTNFYYVDRLSAISKVVDLLGGEIVFYIEIQGNAISGRYMDYLARQGADTSKVFASGSNLLTVERQSDTSNIYTAILPRGKGEEIDNGDADTPDGYGRRINIADVEWKKSAGNPLDKPKGSIVLSDPDATAEWGQINGNARLLLQTYDDIDDVNVLINSAYKTLQSVNHPQIQYSAMVADVGGLSLGDTVLIMHGDRDLSYKTRVFEVKYDLLAPDQTELSLGDDLSSNSITSQINSLNAVADTTSSQTQWTINQIGRPSTTFGNTEPANPKFGDIFFKELPDGGTEIYRWNGDIWELLASPTTADDIATAVTEAVAQANAHTDEVKQGLSSDIATAKSQAASQASTAEANAKSAATSQFTQAQSALSAAKTDLTNSIASEASARTQAVAATNSQAQTYANQAKSDALNAVTKEVTDRQSAISALDTKATNAVNQAKSDITDTINALSVGGRNILLGTGNGFTGIGNNSTNGNFNAQGGQYYLAGGKKLSDLYNQYGSSGYLTLSFDWSASGSTISGQLIPQWNSDPWGGNLDSRPIKPSITNTSGNYKTTVSLNTYGYSTSIATGIRFRQDNLQGNITIKNLKLESGNKATDWAPAPEDVVLDYTTKDNQIKATITQYQETNDGKVTKAQTDATTALGLVATKVSQTDYDQKTGDLTTKYTQVKQTADSQATDIVNIKATATSQASKINSISSDVDGTKQSISDIETTQDSQSDKINQITTDVNGTKQSITDIQTKDGQQDTRMGNIETSVSGVKSDFSTYKTTNDGAVQTAQTTAQAAVDGLKFKVSQTDYNTKTGQLQTDLTTTTQTANQAKTDIVSIKQKDGDQDARMTQIESDASGVKTTVSDLQTTQGKQSGDISILQQRADGFDATVTKVDNLAVGVRNYALNTSNPLTINGTGASNQATSDNTTDPAGRYHIIPDVLGKQTIVSFDLTIDTDMQSGSVISSQVYNYAGNWNIFAQQTGLKAGTTHVSVSWEAPDKNGTGDLALRGVSNGYTGKITISNFSVVLGNQAPVSWLPAPEDVDSATAKAQLTADNASLAISDYKTDADGRISKAQADIVTNANAITQKVSQTDYDKKTGDLTTAVSKAQTTADGVVTTVGNYQTSNDARVKAAESAISQNADAIALKVAKTDYDNNNSNLNTRFTKVEATANGASTTVSDLQQTVNNLGQINRLLNTEFNPDYAAWTVYGDNTILSVDKYWLKNGSNNLVVNRDQDQSNWGYAIQKIAIGQNTTFSFSVNAKINSMISSQGKLYIHLRALDANGNTISDVYKKSTTSTNNFENFSVQNAQTPAGTTAIELAMGMYGGGSVSFNHPFFVLDSHIGNYVAGNYNNNAALAQVKITADSISNFVRDSSGNISSDFQTALSKTSIITGSTLASSIKTQTATQISSALTDNNGKIISLINQDSSGVQIAGKNITLDSNVTVTNAFTVGQANIANGAIGTAQIGDASITSAKIIDLDVSRLTGNTTQFIKSNWDSAYSNVSIDPDSILLNAKSGSTTLTSVSIGSLGMKIEMPGTASFLSDTMINSGGIAFHHAGGTYGSFGMLGNGFTTQYSPTGGAPLGITVGDGRNNDAANMAFGISVSQYAGQAPQLIWAGANTGKVSSSYRTWDNPAGFIIADNIKFSTWDNTASIVEFDSTITYRNWAPDQTYGYIDGNGTKRWFKVSGYTLNGTNKLVGIFGGDGANGIAFDQTGDVWFSNKGNSYSLHDMLAKLNML